MSLLFQKNFAQVEDMESSSNVSKPKENVTIEQPVLFRVYFFLVC